MQITLYNTCPIEYDKKFSQILKQVIRPALKQGRSVMVDEIQEEKRHSKTISSYSGGKKAEGVSARYCHEINDKRIYDGTIRKRKECSTCHKKGMIFERESTLTMKIQIT